jgi:hypothetical protein
MGRKQSCKSDKLQGYQKEKLFDMKKPGKNSEGRLY